MLKKAQAEYWILAIVAIIAIVGLMMVMRGGATGAQGFKVVAQFHLGPEPKERMQKQISCGFNLYVNFATDVCAPVGFFSYGGTPLWLEKLKCPTDCPINKLVEVKEIKQCVLREEKDHTVFGFKGQLLVGINCEERKPPVE